MPDVYMPAMEQTAEYIGYIGQSLILGIGLGAIIGAFGHVISLVRWVFRESV